MSYKNLIAEVLAEHADQLLKKQKKSQDYVNLFPNHKDLPPLLTLADHINAALQPVNPPQTFKDQLQRDLIAAARVKQSEGEQATQKQVMPLPPTVTIALTMLITLIIGLFFFRWKRNHRDLLRPNISRLI